MTAKLFFCFPGQGVQYPGMLENIAHREKWLSQASEALNKDLFGIDSAQALEHTHAVQLCLLISATAQGETLKAASIRPDFVAGLSIGAFAAAVCCGSLEFDDAVRLVALRGELMEHAYPSGYGMTVIIGLHFDKVERLCLATSGVYIANYNAETQIVIAGSEEGMADVCQQALEKGANRVQRINISVPSHCKLLQDASEQLAQAFDSVSLKRPCCTYLSGSTGRAVWQPEAIKADLVRNMARMTRWHDVAIAAHERGARLAIELPPGNILTKLNAAEFGSENVVSCAETNVEKLKDWLECRSVSAQ